MSIFHSIFPKIRKFTNLERHFPLVGITNDGEAVSKGGQFTRVIEISGIDYSGLDDSSIYSYFLARKQFFESLPAEINMQIHSHKRMHRIKDSGTFRHNQIAEAINHKWQEHFKQEYRTRHYIILSTKSLKLPTLSPDRIRAVLKEKTDECINKLNRYGATELKDKNRQGSYWAQILNAKEVHQVLPESGLIDDLLSSSIIRFPSGSPYMVYEQAGNKKFSGWLYFKAPADRSSESLVNKLFTIQEEFSLYQNISVFDKNKALDVVQDKVDNASSFTKHNDIILLEMTELLNRLVADEVALVDHRWALEVFADDPDELASKLLRISSVIEETGFQTAQEKLNQEALFWSRFPELQKYNRRTRRLTSDNAVHLANFSAVAEGTNSCSWGPWPVTRFKTLSGSNYSFIFHNSKNPEALGNTLVIGGSESGKTTLISFLLSQCLKYNPISMYLFDRLQGLRIWTEFHDGSYMSNKDINSIHINPLQLPKSDENMIFLQGWFEMLLNRSSDKDKDIIGKAIRENYDLQKNSRNLAELAVMFGLKDDDSIRKSLDSWLKGGRYGSFFSSKTDNFDLTESILTLDMTALLDKPEVLGPLTYYIFHKILTTATGDGYLVFVDEMGRYLKSEQFAEKIEIMLQEIRKTNGVMIGAVQDAATVLDHKVADKIKKNVSTYILFPDPSAERKHYIDALNLNENEFRWVKEGGARQVLVKRRSGESVVLDIDLSRLGKYLKIFDSSTSSLYRMNEVKKGNPYGWKEDYLNS